MALLGIQIIDKGKRLYVKVFQLINEKEILE